MVKSNDTPAFSPVPVGRCAIDPYAELIRATGQIYLAVAKINLDKNRVSILYSRDLPQNIGLEYDWTEYLEWYILHLQPADGPLLLENFSAPRLLERLRENEAQYVQEFCYYKNGAARWVTAQTFLQADDGGNHAYFTVWRTDDDHLLKSIVNRYVYNNCDYFIYLDAKNNSYTMFSGSTSGTPLPPRQCADYSAELVRYARQFVVPDDQDTVIREMQLERILDVLGRREVHSIHCGVQDPVRGYTRKRLDYRFHDKERKMILLSRTDITDVYLEELRQQETLREALLLAQTDPLTGLLNYQGTVDKITDSLSFGEGRFALMFIDLDDFKTVNDTLGHMAGDELLRQTARAFQAVVREGDLVGRVGGDEFVVFMRRIRSVSEVEACAQRLCDAVQRIGVSERLGVGTSCSIGIALAPEDGTGYGALVKKADRLAYQAKASGKNRYCM